MKEINFFRSSSKMFNVNGEWKHLRDLASNLRIRLHLLQALLRLDDLCSELIVVLHILLSEADRVVREVPGALDDLHPQLRISLRADQRVHPEAVQQLWPQLALLFRLA